MKNSIHIVKKCENCSKEFKPKNYWQRFCSSKCKLISWAIKQKETGNES